MEMRETVGDEKGKDREGESRAGIGLEMCEAGPFRNSSECLDQYI